MAPLPFLASATVSWILWPLTWLVCQFSVSFLACAYSLIVHTLNDLNIFLTYIDTIQNNLQMSQALHRTVLSSALERTVAVWTESLIMVYSFGKKYNIMLRQIALYCCAKNGVQRIPVRLVKLPWNLNLEEVEAARIIFCVSICWPPPIDTLCLGISWLTRFLPRPADFHPCPAPRILCT